MTLPQRVGVAQGGATNRELDKLWRRKEELESIRLGDVETNSKFEDELKKKSEMLRKWTQ
jgi:hypothetical protein